MLGNSTNLAGKSQPSKLGMKKEKGPLDIPRSHRSVGSGGQLEQ